MGFYFKNRTTGEIIGYKAKANQNTAPYASAQSALRFLILKVRPYIRQFENFRADIDIDTDPFLNNIRNSDLVDNKGKIYPFNPDKIIDSCIIHILQRNEYINPIFLKDCLFKKRFDKSKVYVFGKSIPTVGGLKNYRDILREEKKSFNLDRKVLFQAEYSYDLSNLFTNIFLTYFRFDSDSERTVWSLGQTATNNIEVQSISTFENIIKYQGIKYSKFDRVFNQ